MEEELQGRLGEHDRISTKVHRAGQVDQEDEFGCLQFRVGVIVSRQIDKLAVLLRLRDLSHHAALDSVDTCLRLIDLVQEPCLHSHLAVL